MLLQACIKLDLHCQIQFFATNNNPVLYKIIDTAKHQHEPLNASLWYFPQKYCTTEKLVE